jgi:hypothetical protein
METNYLGSLALSRKISGFRAAVCSVSLLRVSCGASAPKAGPGRVARVPVVELKRIAVETVRARLAAAGQMRDELSDREAIEGHVESIIVRPNAVDVTGPVACGAPLCPALAL